jgi:NodT family efflux transporter outer membrane factor (OMF) lipoprotein
MSEVRIALALALLALGGCTSVLGKNKARAPDTSVPAAFTTEAPTGPSLATQKTWDAFFADPDLRALIAEALANNQELNIQLQEIIITQNDVAATRGEYIPKVEGGVGVGVEKVGESTSQGRSDEDHGVGKHLPDIRFGFKASWETDIWGRFRSARKAAKFRYEATVQERNFLVTQIVAEIARSYFELVALDKQLEILDRNIAIQRDALEIIKLKKLAARATELGVQRFHAEVQKNEGRRYSLEQKRIVVESRINFLVGRFPQPIRRNPGALDAVDLRAVTTGLPSELLENRPDVKAAELRLKAAQMDTKSAKARFYPSLSLEAGVGYHAFNLRHLVATPQSLAYDVAGNLVAPLLNRAAIKAEYRTANARQVQAVFDYERVILQAFTDVYNQLTAASNYEQRYARVSEQVATLQAAIEASNLLYQYAQLDYYEVLMTRRDSLEAELDLLETRLDQLEALVSIYQALGGGWRRER